MCSHSPECVSNASVSAFCFREPKHRNRVQNIADRLHCVFTTPTRSSSGSTFRFRDNFVAVSIVKIAMSAIVQGEQLWPSGRTNQTSELLSWRSVMLNCLKRLRRPESLLLQHSLQKQHDVFHRHKDTFNQIWPKKVLFFGWGCLCFCEKIHVFGENVAVALWSP